MPAFVDGVDAQFGLGMPMESPVALPIVTGGIIPTNMYVVRLAPAAAVTGMILQPGTKKGQGLILINESIAANTVTFAAAATSLKADGVAVPLAGLTAQDYVWDTVTNLWYHQL